MNSHKTGNGWRRMVACVQVPGFGLAVEALDNPGLAVRPVALLHSATQALVTEATPVARTAGVAPGMDWATAAAACAGLGRIVARPEHYAGVAARMGEALAAISPELETGLPGTVLLDLTPCQAYYRHDPDRIASLLLDCVRAAGAPVPGVGISGDRTTAQVAARQAGAGGARVVPPDAAAAHLAPLTLEELCGAGPLVTAFLADHGVARCGDMARIPHGLLARRFGNVGRRLWLMAQGRDPAPVRARGPADAREAPGGGLLRTLPPACRDEAALLEALLQLAARLLARLSREGWTGPELRVALRAPEGWRRDVVPLPATADLAALAPPLRRFLRRHWFGEEVRQLHLQPAPPPRDLQQRDFFAAGRRRA
ncbi:MAG TPA: hypothetical protein VFV15_04005 [Moraxellaceae bacterium]|nr:hypothetical protein [Moraxellaceae bacterium]